MEQVRSVVLTAEVDTNKRTYQARWSSDDDTLSVDVGSVANWLNTLVDDYGDLGFIGGLDEAVTSMNEASTTLLAAAAEIARFKEQGRRLRAAVGNPDVCAHCGGKRRGYGSTSGRNVCHADTGLDCYRLVTVHGEPLGARLPGGDLDGAPDPIPGRS